ncbi:3-oxoadipate enol-lactonase 2 [Bordetella tumbae]|uniref:alpha/beta fold hydrolase n=1 Tax=Bordetella tumbae TaxID=1649139 RepID=UPI0039EFACE2
MNAAVRRSGQGAPLVLLHGVGLDHRLWDDLAPCLESDFEVLRYDLLGHGQAAPLRAAVTPEDFAKQLDRVLDQAGWNDAHLLGYSMGGLIAAHYAATRASRVQRLTLLSTVYQRTEAEATAVRARLDASTTQDAQASTAVSLARWFTPAYRETHETRVQEIGQRLLANDRDSFLHAYRMFVTGDRLIDTHAIRCPVLVMTGSDDVGSTPRMSETLAADLPRAQLQIVAGQRHMLPVEAPATVAQALRGFFLPAST